MESASYTSSVGFLERLLRHPGAADLEVRRYLSHCLELKTIAISAASRASAALSRIVASPPPPVVGDSGQIRHVVRLLAAHLYDLVIAIRDAAQEGRVTVAFSLMRISEDSLDLLVGVGCVPGVAQAYTRYEGAIKPSEAAKKFERYLQGTDPERAESWARSRRQLRDALNPLAHASYIGIEQTVRGVVKELEDLGQPVEIAKVSEPIARVYNYLYGLGYSMLEGLRYVYPHEDWIQHSFADTNEDLGRHIALVHALNMVGSRPRES